MMPNDETLVTTTSARRPATLTDYLAVLRRRLWIIVPVPVIAALVAFQYSSSQPSVYEARAQVLVQRSAGAPGVQDPSAYDATRYLTTQAQIARERRLADRIATARDVPPRTADEVLASSRVTPDADADLLNISVSADNPRDAVSLVNAYAREFARYKREVDTARINETLRALRAQARELRRTTGPASTAYQTVVQNEAELQVARLTIEGNTRVLQSATGAEKVQPRPRRAFILAELLGAVFALGLAFLAEALDRRVRDEDEIEEALGLPLIGRVARPPRSLRKNDELVMVADPIGVHAEAFRRLWGRMEFVDIQHGEPSRTIMFTSAAPREGKSTTVANLAIALARSGRHVALVDLDLRRPSLHTFFDVLPRPGFSDVAVGRKALASAIRHVSLPAAGGLEPPEGTNGRPSAAADGLGGPPEIEAVLHFLPCGTIPPAAGEFVATDRVSRLLKELGEEYEVVLVDAPPLTVVGDSMALSAAVDGIVVIAPVGIQRPLLHEVARELQNCRAARLGLVLTGARHSDAHAYGYHSYDQDYQRRARPSGERARPRLFAGLRSARRERGETMEPPREVVLERNDTERGPRADVRSRP